VRAAILEGNAKKNVKRRLILRKQRSTRETFNLNELLHAGALHLSLCDCGVHRKNRDRELHVHGEFVSECFSTNNGRIHKVFIMRSPTSNAWLSILRYRIKSEAVRHLREPRVCSLRFWIGLSIFLYTVQKHGYERADCASAERDWTPHRASHLGTGWVLCADSFSGCRC
jgi:hypothetical protein